ncbi:DUF6053 domain-containing protein [Lysobacter capsici]|uniref:DUF6053 domain-containing protein n=1 Tax=Lysobacter capsici TaxID=435897 RepID=UPI003D2F72E2
MGAASAPTPFDQIAATGPESVGAEVPPTKKPPPTKDLSAMSACDWPATDPAICLRIVASPLFVFA